MDTSTAHGSSTVAESNRQSGRSLLPIVGLGLILLSGLVHLGLTPDQFEDATYLGVLFLAYFASAVVAAVGIYRRRRWGWWLGVTIAVVAIVGYLVRGTVGLPMAGTEALLEPAGVVSKAVELLYLGAAGARLIG